jgi:tetratricopeptide (TPR) repeat protein
MSTASDERQKARLSAFVGRSFLPTDKSVWQDLRDILDGLKPLGFDYEDAKESQPRPISEKVRELILRNDIYIGVLTKRLPVYERPASSSGRLAHAFGYYQPAKWTTSEWVVEEVGFAIGKDRPVILLIEDGVVFPTSDLDADTEWIGFQRTNLPACQTSLTQMISTLVAKRVQSIVPQAPPEAVAPIGAEPSKEPAKASFREQLASLRAYAQSQRSSEADELQESIVGTHEVVEARQLLASFLLVQRAKAGESQALERLHAQVDDNPTDLGSLLDLGEVLLSFKQHDKTVKLFLSHIEQVRPDDRTAVILNASTALRDDEKADQAIDLVLSHLRTQTAENSLVLLYREVAAAAEVLKQWDVEAAFLEKVLELRPTDNDVRFRLAFNYSDADQDKLAAYHYGILAAHVDWAWAINNLGAAYASLGLKAAQAEQYLKATDRYPLSKANLAGIYVEAGFLAKGDELARAALGAVDDQTAQDRAKYVLGQISKMRKEEKEIIEKIGPDCKAEREFLIKYAEGSAAPTLEAFQAKYRTAHGEVLVSFEGNEMRAEGTVTTSHGGGLVALAMLGSKDAGIASTRTMHLILTGSVRGLAARYRLRITDDQDKRASSLLVEAGRTIEGMLIFSPDATSIRFLEREGKDTRFSTATRSN